MSASLHKAARRELRKALGPSAIDTFDRHAAAIAQLSEHAREAFAQQTAQILELKARIEALEQRT